MLNVTQSALSSPAQPDTAITLSRLSSLEQGNHADADSQPTEDCIHGYRAAISPKMPSTAGRTGVGSTRGSGRDHVQASDPAGGIKMINQ